MGNNLCKKTISDGIEVLSFPADRFKTNEFSVSFAIPLSKEDASVNAIVPMILCHSSKKYQDLTSINRHLAYLYGASLSPCVVKSGETQIINIGITSLDDRFSLDEAKISSQCTELIKELILNPRLDSNGLFFEEDVEREKRLLIEMIDSEENEKRIYAVRRLEEEMFKNEPYGVNRYGTKSDVEKITCESATAAWSNLLKKAKIIVTSVGSTNSEEIAEYSKNASNSIFATREYEKPKKAVFVPKADKVETVEERMDIKQGKLVLGFRVNLKPDDELTPAMRSTVDVFGGGPYSRLFSNVREKMSLCYYCSARYVKQKSAVIVQCGCEEKNMDKAVEEILNQLNYVITGDITSEFEASKVGLSDLLKTVLDTPNAIESWFVSQANDDEYITPDESREKNNRVTVDQVKECAKLITLDTVFKLMSKEAE